MEAGTLTLCLTSFTIALSGASMTANYMLQISGYMWIATFIGTCRFGLVLGLVVVILSSVFDLLGVQTAQPVSDIITTLATLPFAVKCLYGFDAEEKKDQAKRRKGAGGGPHGDAAQAALICFVTTVRRVGQRFSMVE